MPSPTPTYVIDDNVPLPPPNGPRAGTLVGAIATLAVGQSLFVPGKRSGAIGGYITAASRFGGRYTARTVTEHDVRGARVWCIERAQVQS